MDPKLPHFKKSSTDWASTMTGIVRNWIWSLLVSMTLFWNVMRPTCSSKPAKQQKTMGSSYELCLNEVQLIFTLSFAAIGGLTILMGIGCYVLWAYDEGKTAQHKHNFCWQLSFLCKQVSAPSIHCSWSAAKSQKIRFDKTKSQRTRNRRGRAGMAQAANQKWFVWL